MNNDDAIIAEYVRQFHPEILTGWEFICFKATWNLLTPLVRCAADALLALSDVFSDFADKLNDNFPYAIHIDEEDERTNEENDG